MIRFNNASMKKLVLLLALSGTAPFFAVAQTPTAPIRVNEACVNFTLQEMETPGKKELVLRELRGRFVILDFFSSFCTVCFRMLPKINALQKQYKDKLDFLLVGISDDRIRAIYKNFKEKYGLELTVAFDGQLHKQLGVEFVPYYIWIDDGGIVRALTGPDAVTGANIEAFLHRRPVVGETLPSQKIPFDIKKFLLVGGNGAPDSSFLFRSIISRWTTAMTTHFPLQIDSTAAPHTFQVLGADMPTLYKYAVWGKGDWGASDPLRQTVYPVPIKMVGTAVADTGQHTGERYCYSVTVPPDQFKKENLQAIMKNALEMFFGWSVKVETRQMPCWVLRATEKAKQELRSKGGAQQGRETHAGIAYVNVRLDRVITLLHNRFPLNRPFLDETGFGETIDLSLNAILTDFDECRSALEKKGLLLTREERPFQVMVLYNEK